MPFNFCPTPRGDPLWQINRHYGVETDYCCVAWRHLAAAAWMIKYFMRPFLLVPFACAAQHQAPAHRIEHETQKRWSENDDNSASERAYSNYILLRGECISNHAPDVNSPSCKTKRRETRCFYCQLYTRHCNIQICRCMLEREKNFADRVCIINLWRDFIAFL